MKSPSNELGGFSEAIASIHLQANEDLKTGHFYDQEVCLQQQVNHSLAELRGESEL